MSHDESHQGPGVEPDVLPLGKLFSYLVGVCAVTVLLLIIVWTYYKSATGELIAARQQVRTDPVLEEAKAADKAALGSYAELDRVKGRYRVPIDRAVDLLIANPALIQAQGAPATAPASAPVDPSAADPSKATSAPAAAPSKAPGKAPAAAPVKAPAAPVKAGSATP